MAVRMPVRFVKMHGLGNDYLFLDAVREPSLMERPDLGHLAERMSDRHRGVGSDGIILIGRANGDAHVRMRIFNSDGSEAEMCGNGVRCVAKFAYERLGLTMNPLRVQGARGVVAIDAQVESGKVVAATVDMGVPRFEPEASGFTQGLAAHAQEAGEGREWLIKGATVPEGVWATVVSMGNPHAVSFVGAEPQDWAAEVRRVGPELEKHPAFAQRVNVHFVRVQSRNAATMWTWERGAGATQACGTGACAVVAAGVVTGRLDREVTLTLPGGELRVRWDGATGRIFKTGPAEEVFEGEWPE